MLLKGSCYCQAVRFEIETPWYYPLMYCYCQFCLKCNGGPVSCNVKGKKADLKITEGEDQLTIYRIRQCERAFCRLCGSSLYLTDDRWPQDCWPNAAAIDTELPVLEQQAHIYAKFKPSWYTIHTPGPQFDEYSEWWIEDFHREWGLAESDGKQR